MYMAYKIGRSTKNPADFWYEGEIGCFDHYVIPLPQKLNDCGVFGVSSREKLELPSQTELNGYTAADRNGGENNRVHI